MLIFIFACHSRNNVDNTDWKKVIPLQWNNFYSFQNDSLDINIHIAKDSAHPSNYIYRFLRGEGFGGITYQGKVGDKFLLAKQVNASAQFLPKNASSKAAIVCIIEDKKGSTKYWQSKDIQSGEVIAGNWMTLNAKFEITSKLEPTDQFVIYVWNSNKEPCYYDNFRTTIITKDTLLKHFYGAYSAPDSNLTHFRKGNQIYRTAEFTPITRCMQLPLSDSLLYAVKDVNSDGIDELLMKGKHSKLINVYQYRLNESVLVKSNIKFSDKNVKWYALNKKYNEVEMAGKSGTFIYSNYNRFNLLYKIKSDTLSIRFLKDKEQIRPNYYEAVLVIPGNFTQKNKQEIISIFCNVKNNDFNGINQFEGLQQIKGLPNGVKIYQSNDE